MDVVGRGSHPGFPRSDSNPGANEIFNELVIDFQNKNESNLEYDLYELSKLVKDPMVDWSDSVLPLLFDILMYVTQKAAFQHGCCVASRAIPLYEPSFVLATVNPSLIERVAMFIKSNETGIWWASKLLGRLARLSESFRDQILGLIPFQDMLGVLRDADSDLWNASIYLLIHRCCTYPVSDASVAMIVEGLSARVRPEMRLEGLSHILDTMILLGSTDAGRDIVARCCGFSDTLSYALVQKITTEKENKYPVKVCLRVLTLCKAVNGYLLSPRTLASMVSSGRLCIAECAMDIVSRMLQEKPDESVECLRKQAIVARLCENIYRSSAELKRRSLMLLCQFMEWANEMDINVILMKTMIGELFGLFQLGDTDILPNLTGLIQQIWTAGLVTPWMARLTLDQFADENVMSTLATLAEHPDKDVADWATAILGEVTKRLDEVSTEPTPSNRDIMMAELGQFSD